MERALLREMEELERTIGELTRRKARKAEAITSPEWQIPAVRVSRRPDGFSGRQEDPASPYSGGVLAYRRLRNRLLIAHDFARKAQASVGVKQKRWYDTRCRGRAFAAGEQVWIYCPERKKCLSPKLRASWRGPGEIVERLSEVVYRIRMPGRGRLVVLHWLPPTGPWQLLMQLSRSEPEPQRHSAERYREDLNDTGGPQATYGDFDERFGTAVSARALLRAEDTLSYPAHSTTNPPARQGGRRRRSPLDTHATTTASEAISHGISQLPSHGSPRRRETRQGRRSEENAAPGTNPALSAPVAKIPATSVEASTSAFIKATEHNFHSRECSTILAGPNFLGRGCPPLTSVTGEQAGGVAGVLAS
ncbi:hypothetical protein SKAU_G00264560 [Synaphobranchus kaupii]|uniref:Integrase p58-like C-terminal domain-containing protein n=1 Tax=Synaphobranchus kaupii TaxID=118154 RepID=A0A9Q1IPR3_SYNKA|nr:hypothetical protein SKAU_G00264560 [Synaphobranchus kaupii]